MGALPVPDVPSGPPRDLVRALHELHHRAGWPSLRRLASHAGCSHTTVSAVFSSPRLPSWGVLELVVEAMEGDTDTFRALWVAAGTSDEAPPSPAGLAGRREELARVRRHLTGGAGLLLVSGEAGIGKTRLVTTAATLSADDVLCAAGSCLPLSAEVPLLPVADVLRSLHDVDGGRWLDQALALCPHYARSSLCRLLPELDSAADPAAGPDDAWSRQRLFAAIAAVLSTAASVRPLAVVLEDLHWADASTLDLVEHLLDRLHGLRVVGTWREEDPATRDSAREWLERVRRLPSVATLTLGPLNRDETAEQLTLLGAVGEPDLAERIHRRSGGLPLFTEQLAAHAADHRTSDDQPLPRLLGDLLARRLAGLGPDATAAARVLAVADRPLPDEMVSEAAGLDATHLTEALHELRDRHVIAVSTGRDVALRHPLLADAVRSGLLGGELVDEHRRLAAALADTEDPAPAEVAEHWQRAETPEEEIVWRVRAARAAGRRFDLDQEAHQWRRVLALWPDGADSVGEPAVRRHDAYVAAIDALHASDAPAALEVAQEALRRLPVPDSLDAAEIYREASTLLAKGGDPDRGLALADRALCIYESHPGSEGHVQALAARAFLMNGLGRHEECAAAIARAVDLSTGLGNRRLHRSLLADRAVHLADEDRLEEALDQIGVAASLELDRPDPMGDIHIALAHTVILQGVGAGADRVAAAAAPGLESVARWGLEVTPVAVVRANVASSLRVAGRVREAAEIVDPHVEGPAVQDRWPLDWERALIDLCRGRGEEATRRLTALSGLFLVDGVNASEFRVDMATVDLWCGRPEKAHTDLARVLPDLDGADPVADVPSLLVLAARAAADLASDPSSPDRRRVLLEELDDLEAAAGGEPFAPRPTDALRRALAASWAAERARLAGTSTIGVWDAAAGAWDRLGWPHEAAYCRWRAAEVALAAGQGTVAARLLRRATQQARGHTPLLAAISGSSAVG